MRVGITGPSRCGKSWLAREIMSGIPDAKRFAGGMYAKEWEGCELLCTDPIHLVKDLEPGVTYVPRDVYELAKAAGEAGDDTPERPWSSASWFVATVFLERPGPWIIEGVALPRALRKWKSYRSRPGAAWPKPPVDRIIYLSEPKAHQEPGQVTQGKGVRTVMAELESWIGDRVEWR